MNQDVKLKWVNALQSEEFKQGQGVLVRAGGDEGYEYCCLGVLSELHARETGAIERRRDDLTGETGYALAGGGDYSEVFTAMPLKETREWAGLDGTDEGFLADLNDQGTPFYGIAQVIRKYL